MAKIIVELDSMDPGIIMAALGREEQHIHNLVHDKKIRVSEGVAWITQIGFIRSSLKKAKRVGTDNRSKVE